ncbi:hypothetical protein [Serratia sp. MYb239]|nr:hypothetical protein [Serratia sp. MYb239]
MEILANGCRRGGIRQSVIYCASQPPSILQAANATNAFMAGIDLMLAVV